MKSHRLKFHILMGKIVTSHHNCWVVGCHYYHGVRSLYVGEVLYLFREPNNPHDRNAIVAQTSTGLKIGHISRSDASMLAHTLDQGVKATATVQEIQTKPARVRVTVMIESDDAQLTSRRLAHADLSSSAHGVKEKTGMPVWAWLLIGFGVLWLLSRQ